MVKFVANTFSVDNSNLYELDGYKPISNDPPSAYNVESKWKNGILKVEVDHGSALKYKIAKIEVSKSKADKIFDGNWEPKVFKGDDTIKGSTQGDTLYGFKGVDKISGVSGDDWLFGNGGDDKLYGGDGHDSLAGGAGADLLDGGTGHNFLTGNGGKDTFAFSAPLSGGNYSEIVDFKHKKDKIQVDNDVFQGVGGKGDLKAGHFSTLEDYTGKQKTIVYDEDTGWLYYSKIGGGLSNAQYFAKVKIGTDLDHHDFLVG
jgi:Ca2+-binding RTX toxin-like protein